MQIAQTNLLPSEEHDWTRPLLVWRVRVLVPVTRLPSSDRSGRCRDLPIVFQDLHIVGFGEGATGKIQSLS